MFGWPWLLGVCLVVGSGAEPVDLFLAGTFPINGVEGWQGGQVTQISIDWRRSQKLASYETKTTHKMGH